MSELSEADKLFNKKMELAKHYQTRIANRQDFEWKVLLALWAAFATAGTGVLLSSSTVTITQDNYDLIWYCCMAYCVVVVILGYVLEHAHSQDKGPHFKLLPDLLEMVYPKEAPPSPSPAPENAPAVTTTTAAQCECEKQKAKIKERWRIARQQFWIWFKITTTWLTIFYLLLALSFRIAPTPTTNPVSPAKITGTFTGTVSPTP